MKFSLIRRWVSWITSHSVVKVFLFILFIGFVLLILEFPYILVTSTPDISVGVVIQQDIQAPRSISYTSDILTEQARKTAGDAVQPVYLPADPAITRRQIEKLQIALNFIVVVREDTFASEENKIRDLTLLYDIPLNKDTAKQILDLNDTRWDGLQQEALKVLEQIMRSTIRESQLSEAVKNIPSLISYTLAQEQANIVAELVTPLVVPNSLYNPEDTLIAREQAQNSIEPILQTFVPGETIINRGEIVTPLVWETLNQFGLIHPKDEKPTMVAGLILVGLVTIIFLQFFPFSKGTLMDRKLGLALSEAAFLIFLLGARIVIPDRTVLPYLYPLAAFGLTIGSIFTPEIGIISSILLSVLSGFGVSRGPELTLFFLLSSITGIFILGKGRHISNFFWSGIAIGITGSAVIWVFRLPESTTDILGMATLTGTAFFNGIASASVTLLLRFVFAQAMQITTPLQLLEISRPDHPLLRILLLEAPGTYQHSLQVANLAEQAAEAIGADPLLTRVGALYHDVGKTLNPSYFIENKLPGQANPHDSLDPLPSSKIIIGHVTEGVKLAQKYRIPLRIQNFIREHHGTLITRYQYTKAVESSGNHPESVDENTFRYPGPKPGSRETALVMLADGCEARVRAEFPANEEDLKTQVRKVFDYAQQEGQLDNTILTLRDIHLAFESFIKTLQNTFHNRIKYPEQLPVPAPLEDESFSMTKPLKQFKRKEKS
jgi:cyclic-di-AMP phosphodiesterase PgpH